MKIIIFDAHCSNPGDLSWDAFNDLGEVVVYPRTRPEESVERGKGADIVLTNKTVLDETVIKQLPKLKYIGVLATGYNVVDTDVAAEHGIVVTNVPAYSTASVVQMVFAHIFHFCQHVVYHDKTVHNGRWTAAMDFCYWDKPLTELDGLNLGIIGFGQIGQAVAKAAHGFGMNVLVHSRTRKEFDACPITYVDLETIFKESDVLSLHCPLTDDTKYIINKDSLKLMKKSALLMNTGRGPLIDEQALADALNSEQIAGAGLDVLSTEPPDKDNPLLSAKNCVITPHIAWATKAARQRLHKVAFDNIKAFQNGTPQNVVNGVK